jgi:hypothetical protein
MAAPWSRLSTIEAYSSACVRSGVRNAIWPAAAAGAQSHDYVMSAVLEVERVCPTLAAVTEDGDPFALQAGGVDV